MFMVLDHKVKHIPYCKQTNNSLEYQIDHGEVAQKHFATAVHIRRQPRFPCYIQKILNSVCVQEKGLEFSRSSLDKSGSCKLQVTGHR